MVMPDVRPAGRFTLDRLDVQNLSVWFDTPGGPLAAVDGVSFSVRQGDHLALIGESGSGKSVTSLAVLGFERGSPGIVGGRIRLNGKDILPSLDAVYPGSGSLDERIAKKRRGPRRWRREVSRLAGPGRGKAIGVSFQDPVQMLDPLYTVGDHLREALTLGPGGQIGDLRQEALEWLGRLGLTDPRKVIRSYPHQLSGGMCQRVVLATALACKPGLLILDEPMSALDATVGSRILLLLRELCANEGLTLLTVSHDLAVVRELASRVVVMYAAQLVEATRFHADGDGGRALRARHPYTRGLIASQVTEELISTGETLPTIPGELTRADRETAGCRFASRCSLRERRAEQGHRAFAERCLHEPPPVVVTDETDGTEDWVRCWDAWSE